MGSAKSLLKKVDVMKAGACPDGICLNVDHCAWRKNAPGKLAVVQVHDLSGTPGQRFSNLHNTMKTYLAIAKRHDGDAIIIVPTNTLATAEGNVPITSTERSELEQHGFKIHTVKWSVPPNADSTMPKEECGKDKYLLLHAFALSKYNTILMYGGDVHAHGHVQEIQNCVGQDMHFLASMGTNSPLSANFLAFRPSHALMTSASSFAKNTTFTSIGGKSVWIGDEVLPTGVRDFEGNQCAEVRGEVCQVLRRLSSIQSYVLLVVLRFCTLCEYCDV
jgi:hypothetical protein